MQYNIYCYKTKLKLLITLLSFYYIVKLTRAVLYKMIISYLIFLVLVLNVRRFKVNKVVQII